GPARRPRADLGGRRGAARGRLPPRRQGARRAVLEGARADAARQRGDDPQRPRGRPGHSARRDRGGGRQRRGLRAARLPAGRRVGAAAPAEPLRGLQGERRPARGLLRRRPRAARRARPLLQPRRPGPGADLRHRDLRAPGGGRARGGRRPDPRGDGEPRLQARLHRRARRRARLPGARRVGRAGRGLQRLLGDAGVGGRPHRLARRGRGPGDRPRGRPGPRPGPRGHGAARLARQAHRRHRLGAPDPARDDARGHRHVVAGGAPQAAGRAV
ncbi:MAG: GDP-mannose 4,6-dehydratase, partial [uncultured Solirubrobacteraceae bacterium]